MLYPSSVLSECQLKSQLHCTIITPEFSRLHGFQLKTLIAGSLLILLQHEVLVIIHGQQGRPCLPSLL